MTKNEMQPMPQNRSTRNTSIRRQTSDSYSALTREQQIQSDNSYNNYLAYIGQMHYQMRKGEEKGFEKGRKEEKISIARSMKADSMPIETIAKYSVSQSTKSMNSNPLKNTLIYIERERHLPISPPRLPLQVVETSRHGISTIPPAKEAVFVSIINQHANNKTT